MGEQEFFEQALLIAMESMLVVKGDYPIDPDWIADRAAAIARALTKERLTFIRERKPYLFSSEDAQNNPQ